MSSRERLNSKLLPSDSSSIAWTCIDTIEKLQANIGKIVTEKGWFVAYLDYQVCIGAFDGMRLLWPKAEEPQPKYIQALRVFNHEQELYIRRTAHESFIGRNRIDGKGNEIPVVEAAQFLWGKKERESNGWLHLKEDRGVELCLPSIAESVPSSERVRLVTRNYVDFNPFGQAGYVDSRFVEFRAGGR